MAQGQQKLPTHLKQLVFIYDLLCMERLTLPEIIDRWNRSSVNNDEPLKRGRFFAFKRELEMFFGIDIDYRRYDSTYHINEARKLKDGSMIKWMIDTARVGTLFLDNFDMAKHFVLEPMPSGDRWLHPLMEAFSANAKIRFVYQKYTEGAEEREFVATPLFVVQYNRRWYLLVERGSATLTFCLDRIKEMEILTRDTSKANMVDADEFFSEFFGIFCDRRIPFEDSVIIRAYGDRAKYLRDLPMHQSQTEIASCDEFTDFRLSLRPDNCFIGEILRLAGQVQVLRPQWLVDKIADAVSKLAQLHPRSLD